MALLYTHVNGASRMRSALSLVVIYAEITALFFRLLMRRSLMEGFQTTAIPPYFSLMIDRLYTNQNKLNSSCEYIKPWNMSQLLPGNWDLITQKSRANHKFYLINVEVRKLVMGQQNVIFKIINFL